MHAIFHDFVLDLEKALKGDFLRFENFLVFLLLEPFRFRAKTQVSLKWCFIICVVVIYIYFIFFFNIVIGWVAHVVIIVGIVIVNVVAIRTFKSRHGVEGCRVDRKGNALVRFRVHYSTKFARTATVPCNGPAQVD